MSAQLNDLDVKRPAHTVAAFQTKTNRGSRMRLGIAR